MQRIVPILLGILILASACVSAKQEPEVIDLAALAAEQPLDPAKTFAEAQKRYTADIRFGLFDEAALWVEPELKSEFQANVRRFREVRFSDYVVESAELDEQGVNATAVVLYRGYSLSQPFEREVRIVQRWRRDAPSHDWYVSPDFDGLLSPTQPPASAY
ncbi:MAG: hypothetical protein QNK05_18295 [Myxococcota bacterium]|nr:hypothetical protein [Myxococcota bacterium]